MKIRLHATFYKEDSKICLYVPLMPFLQFLTNQILLKAKCKMLVTFPLPILCTIIKFSTLTCINMTQTRKSNTADIKEETKHGVIKSTEIKNAIFNN